MKKKKITRKDHDRILYNCKIVYQDLKEYGHITWNNKTVTNEWVLIDKMLHHPAVIDAHVTAEDIFKMALDYHNETKDKTYHITDEDKDLLIEIENVLCKRSRQIWGLAHKRKINGGGDITPYETGYGKLFDYMELVARIIG